MDDLFKFLKRRSPGTAITKEPDGIHVDGWGLFAPLKGFNTSQHWMRLVFRDDGTIDWSQVEQATMQGLADDVPASPAPP
ncbi:MAG: hypothetical protein D8M59_08940 [Planctomycetes bacterium]|nr:hypothetical protein [Planctomycetota bacterium]